MAVYGCKQIFKVCLCLLLLSVWGGPSAHAWNGKRIKWHSYSSGLKKAQKTGKPILMVFEAKWCKICRHYKKVFYKPQVVRLAKKMVMIKVNIAKNRKLQAKYSIDGGYIPRTMAFSPQGYHYDGLTGSHPHYKYFLNHRHAGDLINMMKGALAKTY